MIIPGMEWLMWVYTGLLVAGGIALYVTRPKENRTRSGKEYRVRLILEE